MSKMTATEMGVLRLMVWKYLFGVIMLGVLVLLVMFAFSVSGTDKRFLYTLATFGFFVYTSGFLHGVSASDRGTKLLQKNE